MSKFKDKVTKLPFIIMALLFSPIFFLHIAFEFLSTGCDMLSKGSLWTYEKIIDVLGATYRRVMGE